MQIYKEKSEPPSVSEEKNLEVQFNVQFRVNFYRYHIWEEMKSEGQIWFLKNQEPVTVALDKSNTIPSIPL